MLQTLQRLTPSCRTLVGASSSCRPVGLSWRNTHRKTLVDSVDGGLLSAFPNPYSKFRSTSRTYSTPSKGPSALPQSRVYRVVESFSPQQLVSMNYPVINISGKTRVRFHVPGEAVTASLIPYVAIGTQTQGTLKVILFPPNTVGAFYYHQSQTYPTRLGELRFRLCSDINDFAKGDDLRLPSGDIWHIDLRSLYLSNDYKAIYQCLVREGLLDSQLYPGIPNSLTKRIVTPLKSLHQPFIVDLASSKPDPRLVISLSPPTVMRLHLNYPFQDRSEGPGLGGRAIVRFEPYPKSALPKGATINPLLTLRCLELLTPLRRLSDSDRLLVPTPGQLFMKTYCNYGHIPWYFSARNAATREAIVKWIDTQPSPT